MAESERIFQGADAHGIEFTVEGKRYVALTRKGVEDCCYQTSLGFDGMARGVEAMEIQERIVKEHLVSINIRLVGAYVVSVIFAALAFVLIMHGPSDKATAVNIFSAAFMVLAAGIAGFTGLRAQAPGLSFETLVQDAAAKRSKTPSRAKRHPATALREALGDPAPSSPREGTST